MEVMTNGKRIVRNSQNCNHDKQSVGASDQRMPMAQERENHGNKHSEANPRVYGPGDAAGKVQSDRGKRGPGMFGHELFRVP